MTSTTEQEIQANEDRANALRMLHRYLVPGDTVWCVLRRFDRRTGDKVISLLALDRHNPEPSGLPGVWNISGAVSALTGWKLGDVDGGPPGIVTDAMGMDAGYALVYALAGFMWPDGYDCPLYPACEWNEHQGTDSQPYGGHHGVTGYTLRHRWI